MSTDGIHVESGRATHAECAFPGHSVQLYRTDDYLVADLSRWLRPALTAGDSAVIIATERHQAGLQELLEAQSADVSRAIDEGRYVELDARDTLARFMPDGWPDAARFREFFGPVIDAAQAAARSREPRVYAFGEMVALLWAEHRYQAAARLEQLWNELLKSRTIHLRCAYPVNYFGAQGDGLRFLKLCGEHSRVISAEDQPHSYRIRSDRCRILSVSTNTRLLITRNDTLAVAGYSVASPKEPEEAAFLLATQPFDVIVIADSVRRKNRVELIRALRAIRSDIPIVFVHTGNEASEPLADLSVDVSSGSMALIAALDRQNPVRQIA